VGGAAQTKAMKKVAGTLRTEMAQYRELEAFAQFGSDLDKTTLQQINRGRRLVEVLKQPQYQPMSPEKEVMILFAAANGYLDKWPENRISEYESRMLEEISVKRPELLKEIREKGQISDDLEKRLKSFLDDFEAEF
jgi:F-type H+-transporting ATPase subunit alpha